jgi:SPP1 family predicted phage head-tail adaptor
MRAGPLNCRVTIQQKSSTQDAAGQPVLSWTTLATVWANIAHQSGLESIRANKETSLVRTSIRIRKRADVTAAMRVVYGSTTYEIKAVLPDLEYRDKLDLSCEVVNG